MTLDRWTTEVIEIGDGLGLVLPMAVVHRLDVEAGDGLEIVFGDELRIRPLVPVFCPHCGKELTFEEGVS